MDGGAGVCVRVFDCVVGVLCCGVCGLICV